MRMKINAYLIMVYIGLFETRDSTATHLPTKEKPLTTMDSHSSNESITQTGPVRAAATVYPTQTPGVTAGVTSSSAPHHSPGAQFHAGSFLGGMMLAFVITLAGCVGYRLAYSRQVVHYRAIEEHDAII